MPTRAKVFIVRERSDSYGDRLEMTEKVYGAKVIVQKVPYFGRVFNERNGRNSKGYDFKVSTHEVKRNMTISSTKRYRSRAVALREAFAWKERYRARKGWL